MPRYYSTYKKSKKKTKKQQSSVRWLASVLYILGFAADLWLLAILWFNASRGGNVGETVSHYLYQMFGQSAPLIPVLLTYWLIRSIVKKTTAFFFFLLGAVVTLTAFSSVLTMLRKIFEASHINGGLLGSKVFEGFAQVVGPVGASLFSLALLLVGGNMLVSIPWKVVWQKSIEFLQRDFQGWMEARAELKEKVQEAKAEMKKEKPQVQAQTEETEEEIGEKTPAKPTIYRSASAIKAPVAGLVKELPRSQTTKPTEEKTDTEAEPEKEVKPFDPATFQLPSLDLLASAANNGVVGPTDEEIEKATKHLENTLKNFGVGAHVTGVSPGPVVTRYEILPDAGVKMSSITALTQDIQASMQARSIRVQAPIPGKNTMGFEIPNEKSVMVTMREILESPVYAHSKAILPIALGRHANGDPAATVAEKWPHILIAGATNSGKSICLHTIIMSLLFKHKPDEVKFLMIDPKRVELTLYEGIPYLYDPKTSCDDADIITKPHDAAKSLQMLVKVMEKRLDMCQLAKVKNIEGYNAWAKKNNEEKMFYVFVIIDEMADLMLQTKASIEDSVQRLAQMGRAMGIHLILCTQRPSVKVVTGIIKANMPSRIALQVASGIDSKVILDAVGAENLLGRGDMLLLDSSTQTPLRIQGAYVSPEEIQAVADFLRAQGGPDYPVQIMEDHSAAMRPQDGLGTTPEELLQALQLIKERRRVSQDLLKANFGSSARATNILSVLEMKGFITKPEGSNRWEIHYDLIDSQIEALQNRELNKYAEEEPEYETVYK
ncbi:MAG: DNA translocase FtsK 4TM domain-containing protein [Elusimicrobiaceae bacterium]|nr:DNA translocase FtsK 4TM domain-containing protein [Elusimicrobiaceae bacterium]